MMTDILREPLCPWQTEKSPYADVVMSSHIRLARNMQGLAFPHRADTAALKQVLQAGKERLGTLDAIGHGTYEYVSLGDLTALEREQLVLHQLSTASHIAVPDQRALLVREDGAAVVMMNEDDHFVIETHAAGLSLQRVWDDAAQMDDALEQAINFAFRDDFGYLTTSPSLTGTGLIAGVTVHIPAIVAMKRLNRIVQGITKFGFAIGSLYGQGSETPGNLFEITNQITLGVSESDILEQLRRLVLQIIQEERNCRAILWSHDQSRWIDRFFRAYGLLTYATRMSEGEALRLISDLRLGIDFDVLGEQPVVHAALLRVVEPAFLQGRAEALPISEDDMLQARAKAVHQVLKTYEVAPSSVS